MSTRLVSEPAKFSWKNAASLASSASMPPTESRSMPYASVRLRQWMPSRQSTSPASRAPANANRCGVTSDTVSGVPAASAPTSAATTSGGR